MKSHTKNIGIFFPQRNASGNTTFL